MNSIVEDMLREAVSDHKNNNLKEANNTLINIISDEILDQLRIYFNQK